MVSPFLHLIFFVAGLIRQLDVGATQCGTTEFARKLISRGVATERGEFPFVAALYLIRELKFICGGSLISAKHVLTAAHCIRDHGLTLVADDIFVLLGAYDLTSRIERGAVQREIITIHIHPDWSEYNEKYDADIAILVLSEMVSFSDYIRPVCMPPDNSVVTNANGTIVGWGLTEKGTQPHLKYPKQGITIALDYDYCYTTDYIVAKISSLRTFCGSGGNSSPNQGDSGGGFFILYGSAWVQYGIVSSIRSNATGYVDPNSISIYTNVNEFKTWINDTVIQSGGQIGEVNGIEKIEIQLECQYGHQTKTNFYGCFLNNLDIRSTNVEVVSFTGSHLNGKSDKDVKLIQFGKGTAIYLPDGIAKIFKNVELFEIVKDLKTMRIGSSNFKNLDSLEKLVIEKNDIETLKEDCFWHLPELKHFELLNNKLRNLTENTFVNNGKLRRVDLHGNQLDLIPKNLFQNNSLLEKVYLSKNSFETIDEATFANNGKLMEVDLHDNQLDFIPKNLFQNNLWLNIVSLHLNSLKTIDEMTFVKNDKLRKVYLHDNQLNFIPKNLFQNNLLLEIVYLYANSLKTIDEATFVKNGKLREVYLHDNQLDFIPKSLFRNNSFLELVSLSNNSLNAIDEATFVYNDKLREVYLYDNQLDLIPKSLFQNNSFLDLVNLCNNSLKTIDEATFINNGKLREIYLYRNQLNFIPPNLFQNNLLLEIVSLHVNSLKTIDETTFVNNGKLREVYLYKNQLDFVPGNLFQNNLLLEIIYFSDNYLKVIGIDFTGFKNIKTVDISNNICTSEYYERGASRSLTEFQDTIRANCSSVIP